MMDLLTGDTIWLGAISMNWMRLGLFHDGKIPPVAAPHARQ